MIATTPRTSRDLRQIIIDKATCLFAAHGYSATSMREVASACHCTKPSLYYYFASKDALYKTVIEVHLNVCELMFQSLVADDKSTRECLKTATESYLEWAQTNPCAMRLLQRIETQPEEDAPEFNIAATREMELTLVSSLIEKGIESGEIRAEIAPFDCALLLAGSISFQIDMALGTGCWDRGRLLRTIDMIFDGIAK